jgi:predicted dehydrogenase
MAVSRTNQQRRALIVGAGVSGFLHALALRSAGVESGGVFDPDLARATLLASLVGGEPTCSFAAMTSSDAEVAAVCSPPRLHVEQAEALARPERLVFVEKPVALTHAELGRLRRLPNIVPVLQWRAGRAARELRAALRAGAFGDHPRVRVALRLWRDEAYFEAGRRGRALWGCGAMLSIGIHAIDLLLWLVGRTVIGASGREWCGRPGVDVGTRGELTVLFEGGARAELSITLDQEGANDVHLCVDGASGRADLLAGEGDPTAGTLLLNGIDPGALAHAGGCTASPLLVPFIHDALAAFDSPDPSARLSVEDVAQAHVLAVQITAAQ